MCFMWLRGFVVLSFRGFGFGCEVFGFRGAGWLV